MESGNQAGQRKMLCLNATIAGRNLLWHACFTRFVSFADAEAGKKGRSLLFDCSLDVALQAVRSTIWNPRGAAN